MRSSWLVVAMLVAIGACDGDGCHGGPNGPATQFCQRELERYGNRPGAPSCAQCCIQEVKYEGRVDPKTGLCVCW